MFIDFDENTSGNGAVQTPNIHFIIAWKKIDRPIVTMITEMIGSPIIGRRITSWIRMPNTNMKTSVIGMPSQNGTWNLVSSAQQIHAPTSSSSPCAKLTTCVAL